MEVIEYVDRPGEVRAARPPSMFRNRPIDEIFKELGITMDQVDAEELELPRSQPKESAKKDS